MLCIFGVLVVYGENGENFSWFRVIRHYDLTFAWWFVQPKSKLGMEIVAGKDRFCQKPLQHGSFIFWHISFSPLAELKRNILYRFVKSMIFVLHFFFSFFTLTFAVMWRKSNLFEVDLCAILYLCGQAILFAFLGVGDTIVTFCQCGVSVGAMNVLSDFSLWNVCMHFFPFVSSSYVYNGIITFLGESYKTIFNFYDYNFLSWKDWYE